MPATQRQNKGWRTLDNRITSALNFLELEK